jgi:DNA invertase Pin-like site-specific DNA recombinase
MAGSCWRFSAGWPNSEAGDVLMVMRLDRLARSTRDLLNTLAAIAEKKAGFRSLGDA